MRMVSAEAGGVKFYIETVDEPLDGVNGYTGTNMIPTGVREDLTNLYEEIKGLLKNIASDFGSAFYSKGTAYHPKIVELKLGFSIEGKTNAWVVTCKSNGSFNITFTWEK